MINVRRVELAAAVACVTLAVLAAVYALFGPTISVSTSESAIAVSSISDGDLDQRGAHPEPQPVTETTEHRSLYDDGIEPAAVVYIALMVGLAACVLLLATAHGRSTATRGAAPMSSAAAAMLFLALIAGFSIGLLFLPAALAAIVAAFAGTAHGRELRRSAA
jgi:hypothetical protein